MCILLPMSATPPLHSYMQTFAFEFPCLLNPLYIVTCKHQCTYVALFVCPSHASSAPRPCLDCVHASVHVCMCTWLHPGLLYYLCTGTRKTSVALCVFVCPSLRCSGPIPWLECVHASVHVCMCTWLSMSALLPLQRYMQKMSAPVWHCVCPNQSNKRWRPPIGQLETSNWVPTCWSYFSHIFGDHSTWLHQEWRHKRYAY